MSYLSTLSQPKINTSSAATLTSLVHGSQAGTQLNMNDSTNNSPGTGASAGQLTWVFSQTYSISNGTPITIDLSTSFNDPLGNPITAVNLCTLKATNLSTTAGQDLTVGGGSNPIMASDVFTVQAGVSGTNAVAGVGAVQNFNPGYVVGGSNKILTLTMAAGSGVSIVITMQGN